jgi:hypothetical protein
MRGKYSLLDSKNALTICHIFSYFRLDIPKVVPYLFFLGNGWENTFEEVASPQGQTGKGPNLRGPRAETIRSRTTQRPAEGSGIPHENRGG